MKFYKVGGCIRNKLLGLEPTDIDWVVVGSTPEKMLGFGFKEVGADFPIFLNPTTGEEYALARKEYKEGKGYKGFKCSFGPEVTLEEDLERRDLTINAIAEDPNTGEYIDPFDGMKDLEKGIIRHTSDAFSEDPLRVLRAARFAARFGFMINAGTMVLIQQLVTTGELNHLTPERVWSEIEKALKTDNPKSFFTILRAVGALKVILPELEKLINVPQYHPEGDAFIHTMLVLDNIVNTTPDPVIRFAALTHDLGKGTTCKEDLPSHPTHELRSADIVRDIAKRFKIPNEYTGLAYIVAKYHLRVHKLREAKPKTVLKILNKCDAFRKPDRFHDFLMVCEADQAGKLQKGKYEEKEVLSQILFNINKIDNRKIIGDETRGHVIQQLIHNAQLTQVCKVINAWKKHRDKDND